MNNQVHIVALSNITVTKFKSDTMITCRMSLYRLEHAMGQQMIQKHCEIIEIK